MRNICYSAGEAENYPLNRGHRLLDASVDKPGPTQEGTDTANHAQACKSCFKVILN